MPMRSPADHKAGLRAGQAWKRANRVERLLWSGWTTVIGPWLLNARNEAMHLAGTNQPKGRGYNTAMSKLLAEYGLSDMSKTTRWHLLQIMENLELVEQWRAFIDAPSNLNHPSTVWLQFQESATWQDKLFAERKVVETPKERRKKRADRLAMEAVKGLKASRGFIKQLTERVAELEAAREQQREEIERLRALVAELESDREGEMHRLLTLAALCGWRRVQSG